MPNREEYRAKLQEVMDRWQSEIDALKAEAEKLGEGNRGGHEQKIEDLQDRIAKIEAKLDQLDEPGEPLWDKLKAEVDAILKSMGEGFEKVAAANETEAIKKQPED